MINQIVRLVSPRHLDIFFKEVQAGDDELIIRPLYLSICAADQRYYTGIRKKAVLDKKLPLCLIHEGVGQILHDPRAELKRGSCVALIPNQPTEEDAVIKENYRRGSYFRSSNSDGFMQNLLVLGRDRLLPIGNLDPQTAALLEPVSVIINALDQFSKVAHERRETFGVWGDGSIGYLMTLLLKHFFPRACTYIFGADRQKMEYFSFADHVYSINDIPRHLTIDHSFECVGGPSSADAVNQMINHINPQGAIGLLGVSENPVRIETRMVLEKGLTFFGNSRSSREDFEKAIEVLQDKAVAAYVRNLISELVVINSLDDIYNAFNADTNNPFKTVMRWQM